MATWNTTYNYNQYNGQSMNFGKALLYGAFGQLTGMFGGGCFGGGYGMGMGSYGMGMGGSLFSMMGGCGGFGGFGGFGMYGYGIPDSYVGAQCAVTGMNVLFSAIGGAIKSHRTEKAAANANLDAALKTLDISSVDEFKPNQKFSETSKAKTLNVAITDAVKDAKDKIKVDDTIPDKVGDVTSKTKEIEESGTKKTVTVYVYTNIKGELIEKENKKEVDAEQEADLKLVEANNAKKEQVAELDKVLKADYSSMNITDFNEKLVGADVIAAVKAREDAETKFNDAKNIVQKAYIEEKKQDATSSISSLSRDQKKNSSLAPVITKFKAARKNTNSQTLGELKEAYNSLKGSITEENKNDYKQFSGTLESIVNWYNSVNDNEQLEKISF